MYIYNISTLMNIQQIQKQSSNQLLRKCYRPLLFVLTNTIGCDQQITDSNQQRANNMLMQDDLKYHDILVPQSITEVLNMSSSQICYNVTQNSYLYYMYHIAPIYNWLRKTGSQESDLNITNQYSPKLFQKQVLQHYIDQSRFPNCKDNNNQNNRKNWSISLPNFQHKLQQLSGIFPIVSKCVMAVIQIKSACMQPTKTICRHCIKSKALALNYAYDKTNNILTLNSFYCRDCQSTVQLNNHEAYSILQYPFAPIMKQFHGQTMTVLNKNITHKHHIIKYDLRMVVSEDFILIKAANQIWYKISNAKANTQILQPDFRRLEKESGKISRIYIYARQQMSKDCGVLRLAKPLTKHTNRRISETRKVQADDFNQQPAGKNRQDGKTNIIKDRQRDKANQEDQLNQIQHQNKLNQIQLYSQFNGQTKSKYCSQVQKMIPVNKQKDEYERDYDKGKQKKIKKKTQYIKPNFNQIFKEVKKYNQQLKQGKIEIEKKSKKFKMHQQNKLEGAHHRPFNARKRGGYKQNTKFIQKQKKQKFIQKFNNS